MDHTSELQAILADYFKWNKARLTCMTSIIRALICVRTVNLTQVAAAFQTDCKVESTYRRVCRFFTDFSFDLSSIAPFILMLFPFEKKCILILDRTNWKWGKTPINILMLSIAYKGISIPFFWSVLGLEGNSSMDDRIQLLTQALEKLPLERIEALVADREFIGRAWFAYLININVPFIIRVKKSYKFSTGDKDVPIRIDRYLKEVGKKKKALNLEINLWGLKLFLSFRKGVRGTKEPMILVSNFAFENPFEKYKRRWEIETLFGCLKSRGFQMEDTRLIDPNKIEKMLFVLAIAFCWAYRTGELKSRCEPIRKKAHGRPSVSLFRQGLDVIKRIFWQQGGDLLEKKEFAGILECFDTRCYA